MNGKRTVRVIMILGCIVRLYAMDGSIEMVQFKQRLLAATTGEQVATILGYDTAIYELRFDIDLMQGFYLHTIRDGMASKSQLVQHLNIMFAHDLHQFVFGSTQYDQAASVIQQYPVSQSDRYAIMHAIRCIKKPEFIVTGHAQQERDAVAERAAHLRNFVASHTNENNVFTGKNYFFDRCKAQHRSIIAAAFCATIIMLAIVYMVQKYDSMEESDDQQDG